MKNKEKHDADNAKASTNINLGLDADHSSDGATLHNKLNDDNDRITGNPNGENDEREEGDLAITSPIDEK